MPFFSFKDLLNLTSDPWNKIYNMMKLADGGDKNAQAQLKYVFHEAGRETLKTASSTFNDMALISLCIGFPEGTSVFGAVSTASELILVIDDFLNGNKKKGFAEGVVVAVSWVVNHKTKKIAEKVAGISVYVGNSGKYYEIGKRGAIKTKTALRKIIERDIASGYFGKEIAPVLASQIVEKAAEWLKEVLKIEESEEQEQEEKEK